MRVTQRQGIRLSRVQTGTSHANYLLLEGVLAQSLVPPQFIDESSLQDVSSQTKVTQTLTTDESLPSMEEVDLSLVPEAARQSPIGYLHESLQRLKMKRPEYFYHPVGNEWLCRCQVQWFDEPLIETNAIEASKKDAKTNASLKAIRKRIWRSQRAHLEQFVVSELEE